MLVGTKCEREGEREVSTEEGRQCAGILSFLSSFIISFLVYGYNHYGLLKINGELGSLKHQHGSQRMYKRSS